MSETFMSRTFSVFIIKMVKRFSRILEIIVCIPSDIHYTERLTWKISRKSIVTSSDKQIAKQE